MFLLLTAQRAVNLPSMVNANPTSSEVYFETWCKNSGIENRRIKEAFTQGNQRPDYAIRINQQWCIVEVKQLDPQPDDEKLRKELIAGNSGVRWLDPGVRLRHPIRVAARQLRKFSKRGLPTVLCLFDQTISFHLEPFQLEQAMFGVRKLHFEVSENPAHQPRFLGNRFGEKSTLTKSTNTSISAVAVLYLSPEHILSVDLYHNPYARVPIPLDVSAAFVRKQYPDDTEQHETTTKPIEWREDIWEWFDQEVKKCLDLKSS